MRAALPSATRSACSPTFDPFKFLIYAELAGAEIGPVE